jgi:hypothetical protein
MLMSDVLTYVMIAAAFVFGSTAMWMLSRSLWPTAFEKRRALSEHGVLRNLLIGIVPTVMLAFILAAIRGRLGIVVALVATLLVAYGLFGLSGYAAVIGERLWPQGRPWRQSRNGGLVLICTALFPVVGWFLIFPLMIVLGLGVNTRTLKRA